MRNDRTSRILRTVLAVVAMVLITAPLGRAATEEPQFTYQSINTAQSEAISWALELFEQAELELPDIEFVGHVDREACHGRDGAARDVEDGAVVHICAQEIGSVQEWVILHEIAHAWDYHNLDDGTKTAFLELRDLKGWREGEWHERGAENAAEIMVWGLIDRAVQPSHIYDNDCDQLLAGYVTLTGQQPLHGYTDVCEK